MASHVRQIAHLDLDCFFVSAERIKDPRLAGRPVVVGGSPDGRGVVASASYEARAFGVRSAMPTGKALRLCPDLIVVRSSHNDYGEISDRLYRRMCEIAPLVERASIDEMYLDFTGCEHLYGKDLGPFLSTLQRLVLDEFSLPCSIALATTKTIAKIAVGTVKPLGLRVVPQGEEGHFLAPLPICVVPGIGTKTEAFLVSRGFSVVADLQRLSQLEMHRLLGAHAQWLYDVVHGGGNDSVETGHVRKSIGREETFASDLRENSDIEQELHALVEDVCGRLRAFGWQARTIQLKLRYSDFDTITRARTVEPVDHDAVVFAAVRELFHASYDRRRAVRLLGVQLSHFEEGEQLELALDPRTRRREEVLKAVDALRAKFGDAVIHVGQA
jgi:DNA polymerase-4